MNKRFFLAALASLAAGLLTWPLTALAQTTAEAPDVQVRRVADEVLQIVRSDAKVQAGDPARVREVLDAKLLPHFDFRRMTMLVMGRNWRLATPEQQTELVEQFRMLLVRTYSGALAQFKDDTINVKPLRAAADAKEVTVYSEVIRSKAATVPVDYSLILSSDGQWRCYDVMVGGVSLVTNYRDDFNQQIKTDGIDGLLKTLAAKNKGATP
ncbi:MAG: ABC transporter substrate-binding protein [Burkholderiales bacterium]|jgi:phospholipid transport system substrate-binding protein|nr:ABC transporter substrate-binding protein [Burkholderiales bacterium]